MGVDIAFYYFLYGYWQFYIINIYTYMLHKYNYIYIYDTYKHISDDAESDHCLEKEKYWFDEKWYRRLYNYQIKAAAPKLYS